MDTPQQPSEGPAQPDHGSADREALAAECEAFGVERQAAVGPAPTVGRDATDRRVQTGGGRRQARVLAFKVLYEADVARHPPSEVLERLLRAETADPKAAAYARELIGGVLRHRQELGATIQELAPAWPLRQVAPVARAIRRLGLYESRPGYVSVPL